MDSDIWGQAVGHPFLEHCKNASVAPQSFNWWLEQDYGFVQEFESFSKAILSNAPAADTSVLRSGIAALDDELKFFKVSRSQHWGPSGPFTLELPDLHAGYLLLLQWLHVDIAWRLSEWWI